MARSLEDLRLPEDRRWWVAGAAAIAVAVAILVVVILDGEALSKKELIKEGDEICRQGQERFREIQEEPPQTADQAAEQTADLVDAAEDEVGELSDLEPPSKLEGEMERYLEMREDALDSLREGLEAAEDQDARAYGRAQSEVARADDERLRLARKVGFRNCSNPGGASPQS